MLLLYRTRPSQLDLLDKDKTHGYNDRSNGVQGLLLGSEWLR